MMAGVGIMLAFVAVNLYASEKFSGAMSFVSALVVWFITKDLAKTIIVSVLASTAVYNYLRYVAKKEVDAPEVHLENERFHFGNIEWCFWRNRAVFLGALGIACLNIGANISFGKITGSIANTSTNIDHLAIYSSVADILSTLFGGGPVEAIISGTATAPNPLRSSVTDDGHHGGDPAFQAAAGHRPLRAPVLHRGIFVHPGHLRHVLDRTSRAPSPRPQPSRDPTASPPGGWSSGPPRSFRRVGTRSTGCWPDWRSSWPSSCRGRGKCRKARTVSTSSA